MSLDATTAAVVDRVETELDRRRLEAAPEVRPTPSSWPSLAPEALTGLPGAVVAALEPHSEADPAALLVTFLVAFGGMVGRGPHFLADGSEHCARLFTVVVGATSKARKGTSWAQVKRILTQVDPIFVKGRVLGGFGSGESVVDAVAPDKDGNGDHRALVVEPEWARLLNVGRREGSTLSPLLRQAWDGDRLAVRTRASTVVADGAHVAVLGHVTVEELKTRLVDVEVANGYANRHLFAVARRSKLLPSGGNLDDSVVSELARVIKEALTATRTIGRMRRTPRADSLWAELYAEMDRDDPGGMLGAIIARDAAQVLRLSITYALADGSSKIDLAHLEAAWAVWRYCRTSAAMIFGERIGDPIADKLLEALRAAGRAGLDGRDIHRTLGGHVDARRVAAARQLLIERNLVTVEEIDTGGRPRMVTVAVEHTNQASNPSKAPLSPGPRPLCSVSSHSSQHWERPKGHRPEPSFDQAPPPSDEDISQWDGVEEEEEERL